MLETIMAPVIAVSDISFILDDANLGNIAYDPLDEKKYSGHESSKCNNIDSAFHQNW